MLLSEEAAELAKAFAREVGTRRELAILLPPELLDHDEFWQIMFDLMENVIHRSGCLIVHDDDMRLRRKGRLAHRPVDASNPVAQSAATGGGPGATAANLA